MPSTTTTILLSFALLTARVSAHGYMPAITIAGKSYEGNKMGETSVKSVIRSVNAQDPMKGADNKDLSCGPGSEAAKLMADAQPGDEMGFSWKGAYDGNNWIHDVGPMLTYMALCGDGSEDCADVDSTKAEWFKIDEQGILDDGTWAQAKMQEGEDAKVTLPSNLAAGNYLIRHEVLALHNALSEGGAEFYAGCVQLTVKGSETGAPSSKDLVEFPGAYSDSDPGITVPTIFNGMKKGEYEFPGPDVSKLGGSGGSSSGGSSGSDNDDDSSSSSATSTKTSSSSAASPTSNVHAGTGSCKLSRRSKNSQKKRGSYTPKRFHSRIARNDKALL